MRWVVVGLATFDAWAQNVDDVDTRLAVLEWLVGLSDSGPPAEGALGCSVPLMSQKVDDET